MRNQLYTAFNVVGLILPVLILFATSAKATHIVGGDLELIHVSGFEYRVALNLYNDDINGDPGALDNQLSLGVYEKSAFGIRNATLLQIVNLSNPSRVSVPYSNPSCATGNLQTSIVRYEKIIRLAPNVYNSPNGYFITWERCCRNFEIDNISNPGSTGMTFLLEFPPVNITNNGELNSTPKFKAIEGDYACVDRQFTFNFGASDADGDNLVYQLTPSIAGSSNDSRPKPAPLTGIFTQDYEIPVSYLPGFSANNPFGAASQTSINSSTGVVTFTPSEVGLFVIAVEVLEYRNGVLIGANRREFQIRVLDCPDYSPPVVTQLDNNADPKIYSPGDTLFVFGGELGCATLKVTDPDPFESFTIEAIPVNFETRDGIDVSPTSASISGPSDTAIFSVCAPRCVPGFDGDVYLVDIIIRDNACPRPNADTVRYIFKEVIEDNNKPNPPRILQVNSGQDSTLSIDSQNVNLTVGESVKLLIEISDPDTVDQIKINYWSNDIDLDAIGLSIPQEFFPNPTTFETFWDLECNALESNRKNSNGESLIEIFFAVEDDRCNRAVGDTQSVIITIKDIPSGLEDFVVYNVVTPNGDNINDIWELDNLPLPNCQIGSLQSIKLFNRWGREVMSQENQSGAAVGSDAIREFQWEPDVPPGTYYYFIKYENIDFKGWLTIL